MITTLLAQATATPSATPSPTPKVTQTPPQDVEEATNLIIDMVTGLYEGFVERLPLFGIAIVLVVAGILLAKLLGNWARRGTARAGGDKVIAGLAERLTRSAVFVAFALLALSIAGVPVSAALAGLGIAGLAVAFALQSILENFVAGLILIMRKPFSAGDQIMISDFEGTVTDIDLRTTRLVDYDGELVIIPNATVFGETIINLTHARHRRSAIQFGIDYRDDHNAAAAVIREAVGSIACVLDSPPVTVLCTALGESSVDFAVYYWTAPRIADVVDAQDQVLRATKSALDDNGFSIPWPMRTLVVDPDANNVLRHRADDPA